jgi:hypothetical protein
VTGSEKRLSAGKMGQKMRRNPLKLNYFALSAHFSACKSSKITENTP